MQLLDSQPPYAKVTVGARTVGDGVAFLFDMRKLFVVGLDTVDEVGGVGVKGVEELFDGGYRGRGVEELFEKGFELPTALFQPLPLCGGLQKVCGQRHLVLLGKSHRTLEDDRVDGVGRVDGNGGDDAAVRLTALRRFDTFKEIVVEHVGVLGVRADEFVEEDHTLCGIFAHFKLRTETGDGPKRGDARAQHLVTLLLHHGVVALLQQVVAVLYDRIEPRHEGTVFERSDVRGELQVHVGVDETGVEDGVGFGANKRCIGVDFEQFFGQVDCLNAAVERDGEVFDEFSVDIEIVCDDDLHSVTFLGFKPIWIK